MMSGCLPVSPDAAEALFRVVDAAYEKRSIALIVNIHPAGFDELMPKTLATATVDRLLHHAHVLITDGHRQLPARPSDRRQGGDGPWPETDSKRPSPLASPYGLGSAATVAHPTRSWGELMATSGEKTMAAGGENRWPYLGRNRWPLTSGAGDARVLYAGSRLVHSERRGQATLAWLG